MPVHITLIEFLCGFGIDGPMNWSAIDWLPFNVILSVPISIGLMFELSSLKVKVVFFFGTCCGTNMQSGAKPAFVLIPLVSVWLVEYHHLESQL